MYDDKVTERNLIIKVNEKIRKPKRETWIQSYCDRNKAFILLLSGYNSVARYWMYWEQKVDCSFQGVVYLMPRNRFKELLWYFHVADNNSLAPDDKFAKVRLFWNLLTERWLKFCLGDKNSKHGAKQQTHGKQILYTANV